MDQSDNVCQGKKCFNALFHNISIIVLNAILIDDWIIDILIIVVIFFNFNINHIFCCMYDNFFG